MKSLRWNVFAVLPLFGALAGVVGCAAETGSIKADDAGEVAQGLAQERDDADEDGAKGPRGHHGRRPPGPEMLVFTALHELDLTAAQRATIEGSIEKMKGGREPGAKDRAAFTTLAAGVRAGKVDSASVLAQVGGEGRADEHRAAVASALQTLHATLTAEQRRELVDTVTKRMEEHGPRGDHAGKRGPGARGVEGPGELGPIGHLLEGIELSDAQRTSIRTALDAQRPAPPDHEAMKKHHEARRTEMRARTESFASTTFDAKALMTPPAGAPAAGPKHPIERMIADLAVIVPILEPLQREALAVRLEQGPPAHMGPPGAPHARGERRKHG